MGVIKPLPSQRYKNDDIRTAILDNCKLDGYSDKVPAEVEDKIRLSVDVSPRNNRICNIVKSRSGSGVSTVMYTTPQDKDFYLTNCALSISIGALNGGSVASLSATVNSLISLIQIPYNNSTGNIINLSVVKDLYVPIKIDRGTQITINIDDAGDSQLDAEIFGYTVDTNIYDTGLNTSNTQLPI